MRALLGTLVVMLALGCGGGASSGSAGASGGEGSTGGEGAAATTGPLVANGEAAVGDRTTCPIMNEEFTITADSPHAEYEGRTYYFCCPPCVEQFLADPARYTGGAATTTPAAAPTGG